MDVVGYATIKDKPTTYTGHLPVEAFTKQPVRVMEFTDDGSVLVMSPNADGLGMFDACDVHRKFECIVNGEFIIAPGTSFTSQMVYMAKVMARTGGYNQLLRQMIITASLHKGTFTDNLLWAAQPA